MKNFGEDKIRITLNKQDLDEKHIDIHSFMANSLETQDLFLNLLEQAEEEVGFITKNYQIRIEALATMEGDFVFTVTRMCPTGREKKTYKNRKVRTKRKTYNLSATTAIYLFASFDDFCEFCNFLDTDSFLFVPKIAKKILLYEYHENYYLVLSDIHISPKSLIQFHSCISEFASNIHNGKLFQRKLQEHGKLIMKHNALKTGKQFFSKK